MLKKNWGLRNHPVKPIKYFPLKGTHTNKEEKLTMSCFHIISMLCKLALTWTETLVTVVSADDRIRLTLEDFLRMF